MAHPITPALLARLTLFTAVAILYGPAGSDSARATNRASPDRAAREPLVCERPHIDVGETSTVDQVQKFEIKNNSDAEVRITATNKACGCVKREFTKYTVAPGETTEMTLEFPIRTKPGVLDSFLERLSVFIDDQHDTPALVLTVGGTFVPVAHRLRDGIYIEARPDLGKRFKGSIEIFLNKGRGVDITSVETLGSMPIEAAIAKREETLTDGEERVLLEVAGDLGKDMVFPGTATVLVKLNNDDLPEMNIPVTLYRKRDHEVRFSPQQLAFGVLRSGAKVKKAITVELPESAKYAVESAEPSGEGVTVMIEEKPKASKHITLLRCELDTSGVTGKVEQELRISVTVPDGPPEVYKLPISGFVKPAESEQASKK